MRHEPPGLEGEALDKHTLDWVERVNNSGGAYLTPSILDGRWMVRVSIGAITTERQHVEALWALMRREAENNELSEHFPMSNQEFELNRQDYQILENLQN